MCHPVFTIKMYCEHICKSALEKNGGKNTEDLANPECETKSPTMIWEKATLPPLLADPLIATMCNRSTVFAMWRQ